MTLGAGFTLLGLCVLLSWLTVLGAIVGVGGLVDLRDRAWLLGLCGLAGTGGAGLWLVLWWLTRATRAMNTNLAVGVGAGAVRGRSNLWSLRPLGPSPLVFSLRTSWGR